MMYKRPGIFQNIPPVTLNLIIINCLCLLATVVLQTRGTNLNGILGLHYFEASKFNPVQLITYMFMHGGISHLFFNMFSLFMFGRMLEQVWGSKRFLIYYMVTGIGAGLVQEAVWWIQIREMLSHETIHIAQYTLSRSEFLINYMADYLNYAFLTVGASGAVFGILLAFGMLFPNAELFMMFIPIPIKAKYFVIGYGILELFLGVGNFSGDNIAHFAHLGGMIFGFILIKIWKKQDFNNGKYFY
ncbi:MAG: rhomboid family intramembrane serine protease [Bacteroidales bacterium]